MNRPLRVKETYADIAEKNKSAKHTAVTDGTGVKSVFLITITLMIIVVDKQLNVKNVYLTIERQEKKKRHSMEQLKCFSCATYCVKQYFIAKLKRQRCIENTFANFVKIRKKCSQIL